MTNEEVVWFTNVELEDVLLYWQTPEPLTMPNIPLMPLAEEFKMRRELETWRWLAICLGAAACLLIIEAVLR